MSLLTTVHFLTLLPYLYKANKLFLNIHVILYMNDTVVTNYIKLCVVHKTHLNYTSYVNKETNIRMF